MPIQASDGPVRISLQPSPNHFTWLDLSYLAISALLKHVFAFLAYSPSLQPDASSRQAFKLPHIRIDGQLQLDNSDLLRFTQATDRTATGDAVVKDKDINPMLLIASTAPLLLSILAHRSCPIKPLGAVNTRNKFSFRDPTICRDFHRLKAAADRGQLSYSAAFGGPERPGHRRKRGIEFCITIAVVAEGSVILDQELWFLQFLSPATLPRHEPMPSDQSDSIAEQPVDGQNVKELSLSPRDPLKWAASCKDYNPIHVSTLGAKVFGFKSVIAHGNHVAALVIQQLQGPLLAITDERKAGARSFRWESNSPFTLDVRFLRPVTLPAKATVQYTQQSPDLDEDAFFVLTRGKPCLYGSCTALEG